MKDFLKNNIENILIVCLAIACFLAIKPVADRFTQLEQSVQVLKDARTYNDGEVIVAPNLICDNCGGTTYRGNYDEHSRMVHYACCTCSRYRVVVQRDGAILLPTKLKVFRQNYKKFKQGNLDYIDENFIEGHAYCGVEAKK